MAPRMMPRTNPGVWQLSSAAEVKDKNFLFKLGVMVPSNYSLSVLKEVEETLDGEIEISYL